MSFVIATQISVFSLLHLIELTKVYLKNGSGEKNLYKGIKSELPLTLPLTALSSQPFEGSASYFEEKAKYMDYTDTAQVSFITIRLDNKLLKDVSGNKYTGKEA